MWKKGCQIHLGAQSDAIWPALYSILVSRVLSLIVIQRFIETFRPVDTVIAKVLTKV